MFVSLASLQKAIKGLKIPGPSVFTNFLSIKYIGTSTEWQPCFTDEWRQKAYESVLYLMFLYEEGEKLPNRYQLILPFEMEWHAQSISEKADQYGSGRIKNNIDGGTPAWKDIIDIDRNSLPMRLKLKEDYVQRIREVCLQNTQVDIKLLAGWILRRENMDFGENKDRELTMYSVRIFKRLFNITPFEESLLFHYNGPDLTYSPSPTPMKEIRRMLGNPPKPQQTIDEYAKKVSVESNIKTLSKSISSENISFDRVKELLMTSKQLILFGPPGTSKTFYAKKIGEKFFAGQTTFVQFHQSYGYEEFIGGIRPNNRVFQPVPGTLTNLAETAEKTKDKNFLLVIDEINRGNLSKILGEAIVCLDRDSPSIQLSYDPTKRLKLPDNLYIIGTMNSTDRQIALVDYALRRRFEFIYLKPDSDILSNYTNDKKLGDISITAFFNKINKRIAANLNEDFLLGHTYFMPNRIFDASKREYVWSNDEMERVINYSILPILEEYCYGNKQMLTNILGPDIVNRLTGQKFIAAIISYLR